MDPREFFAQSGLPQPSSFPTRAELTSKATKLSKQILDDWKTLRIIVERRETSLRKRWLKRTQEQRKAILEKALPKIPAKHRPDIEAFKKESPAERQAGTKFLDAYLRPYINIEDLMEGKMLLMFINSRARNPPSIFARADFNALHFGHISGAVMPAFFNEHTMLLSDASSFAKYGKVISWVDDDRAFDWMQEGIEFMPGEGLLVLEVQSGLYKFLFKCCRALFQDVDLEELLNETLPVLPEPEAIVNKESAYASIAVVAAEAPYRPPPMVDFARLRDIVAAQRDAAVDHFWALREDPFYFAATIRDWADHRQETLLDTRGRPHPLLDNTVFWDRVTSVVVNNTYETVSQWVIIHEKLQRVAECQQRYKMSGSPQSLPEDYERSLRRLQDVVDKLSKMPIHLLKIGVPPSPPMRSKWVREPQKPGTTKIITITKDGMNNDPLLFIFDIIWDDQQRFLFTLPLLMDEIERTIHRDTKQKQMISSWVGDRISDLSIMAEILHQIQLHPGVAKFEQIWDDGDAEASTKASIELITRMSGAGSHCPDLGSLVTPLSKFTYPVERRRNASNVEILRTAEKNLDTFWLKVDRELVDMDGIPQRERLVHILPHADIQRTPKWVEPDTIDNAQTSEPFHEPNAGFSHLGQTAEKPEWTKPDEKTKSKTRGIAKPLPAISLREPAAVEPQPDTPPIFTISKRAYKVFSTLFHVPTTADQVGEISWTDFLHAMAATGFQIEKLYGSVWQFTPKKLDVENGICFHEPHPSGKIPFRMSRRMGRRLNRMYGWCGEMFRLEEKR